VIGLATPPPSYATPLPAPIPISATPVPTTPAPTGPIVLPSRRGWPKPIDDTQAFSALLVNVLEYQGLSDPGAVRYDLQGWYGGDRTKLWMKSESRLPSLPGGAREVEGQLLYSRLATAFFDVQAGVRFAPALAGSPSRTYLALGLQGLAPYSYDVEPTLFLSQRGIPSFRFTGSYDFRLTQRLVLQPRLELNLSAAEDEPIGVGAGLSDAEAGLRLRYQIDREVAPYVGVDWMSSFGRTRVFAIRNGDPASQSPLVAGLRLVL